MTGIYNDVLRQMRDLLPDVPSKRAAYSEDACAKDGEKDRILFRSDTAYELGGGGKPGAQAVLFAELEGQESETLLYGPDLCDISSDAAFGHFTVVRLKDSGDDSVTSERLKTVGFTVFQLYPEGYHVRISPSLCREQVRVSKAALKCAPPLSFINVGNSLIRAFLRQPDVERVQTIFITAPDVDHLALARLAAKAKRITDAVQSALDLKELDCASCKMKPVCDEIDGLREMHFRKEKKAGNNS